MVPVGGVPGLACELVPAGDLRQRRPAELADRADQCSPLQRTAALQGQIPERVALVESGRRYSTAEPKMRAEIVLGHQGVQVRQDLGPRREAPTPAPGAIRERVQLRRYVARQSWIAIVAPDSAEVARAVKHDEVVDARLLERDRHPDAA